MCCRLKMKLEELWQRTSGCILKIRGVTPDGAGNFELEAGQNVKISEVSNGLRISTTGGVSYYTSDDPQLDIDNDDLKISLVDVLVATPAGNSQIVNGRLYFPSYDIVGSKRGNNRNDMHIDSYNPTTKTISRLVITMRNDGTAQVILEKWNAALDQNGNPYATTYITGTSIATTS